MTLQASSPLTSDEILVPEPAAEADRSLTGAAPQDLADPAEPDPALAVPAPAEPVLDRTARYLLGPTVFCA